MAGLFIPNENLIRLRPLCPAQFWVISARTDVGGYGALTQRRILAGELPARGYYCRTIRFMILLKLESIRVPGLWFACGEGINASARLQQQPLERWPQ
jgi:hypothetical protein